MNLLCLGYGYCAQHLTMLLRAVLPGACVIGTSRSAEMRDTIMSQKEIEMLDWQDGTAIHNAIAQASHILLSIPPE